MWDGQGSGYTYLTLPVMGVVYCMSHFLWEIGCTVCCTSCGKLGVLYVALPVGEVGVLYVTLPVGD